MPDGDSIRQPPYSPNKLPLKWCGEIEADDLVQAARSRLIKTVGRLVPGDLTACGMMMTGGGIPNRTFWLQRANDRGDMGKGVAKFESGLLFPARGYLALALHDGTALEALTLGRGDDTITMYRDGARWGHVRLLSRKNVLRETATCKWELCLQESVFGLISSPPCVSWDSLAIDRPSGQKLPVTLLAPGTFADFARAFLRLLILPITLLLLHPPPYREQQLVIPSQSRQWLTDDELLFYTFSVVVLRQMIFGYGAQDA